MKMVVLVKRMAERAKKSSIWLITVNPNKCFNCSTDKCFKSAYHALDAAALAVGNNLREYLQLTPAATKRGDEISSAFISRLRYKWVIELGDDKKRLHAHLFIYARHNTLLRLNYDRIKKAFIDALGCPVYMNSKVASNATQNFEAYIAKSRKPQQLDVLVDQ
jgi:hypothetical protein